MARVFRTGLPALPLVITILAATGVPVAAGDAITVRLLPSSLLENQDLKAMVRVEKQADNRTLSVALDGPAFYSSTERPLAGTAAPTMHEFQFRALPAGSYTLTVRVQDAGGTVRVAQRRFEVHGISIEAPPNGSRGRRP